jgi:hypothetical protein
MITPFAYAEAASGSIARAQLTALRIAMGLLELAPLWLLAVLVLGVVRRRRVVAFDLALWPAIAGLCAIALPRLVIEADNLEVIGERHPLTIAIYVTTLVFAFAACASVVAAVRWSLRTDRPPWWSRLVPSLCAVAALGLAIWLDANHVIGLRLSAW